jgi:uncharacterized caspase-like protein
MNRHLLLTLAGLLTFHFSTKAADRVALVIGNGAYEHGNKLANPVNDATDVAASLKACGFSLVGDGPVTDLGYEALSSKVAQFKKASADAKVALFFFAGHGMEVDGANYLMPVDAKIEEKYQVKHRTLALDEVLESMAGEDRLKVVILDCCRDNPVARSWGRSGTGGLAIPTSTPGGTVLLFATAPGRTAEDGKGRNSPFSEVLKDALKTPGSDLDSVFKNVGATVKAKTGNQEPWMNSSYYGRFLFIPSVAAPTSPQVEKPDSRIATSSKDLRMSDDELAFWVKKLNLKGRGIEQGFRKVFQARIRDTIGAPSIGLHGFNQPLLISGDKITFGFTPMQDAVKWNQSDRLSLELCVDDPNLIWVKNQQSGSTKGFLPKGAGCKIASLPKRFFFRIADVDASRFDPTMPVAMLVWTVPYYAAIGTSVSDAMPAPNSEEFQRVDATFVFLDLVK